MARGIDNYGTRTGLRNTRRVWLALSQGVRGEKPLMRATQLGRETVWTAVRRLEAAGYIERTPGVQNSIIVVVPFVAIKPSSVKKPAGGARVISAYWVAPPRR